MSWEWLRGHQTQVEMFRAAVSAGRLGSTFLFIGPSGIGKRAFAVELAKALLCENTSESDATAQSLTACDRCPCCIQVAADTHPDVIRISKPEEKSSLPIELFIGDRDHRMRVGLCHDISLKPHSGRRKVAIIDDADFFNQESANCLLKTLEEPPPGSLLIMLGTSLQKQLPTIRSRSQVVRFQPLCEADVSLLLAERHPDLSEEQIARAAAQAEGSLTLAEWFCEPVTSAFRDELLTFLSNPRCDTVELSRSVLEFVESKGTEAPAKRRQMRQVARIAAMFYRDILLVASSAGSAPDHVKWWPGEGAAIDCMDRCIEAELQIDANANSSNWVEALVDGLTYGGLLAK